jgi:hypothetical protein
MSDTARRILLGIFLMGVAGISAELLLLGHDEDFYQLIPLVLAAGAVVSLGVLLLAPSGTTVRAFRAVMAFFILSGVLGAVLHFQVNLEFQLEMDPSLRGMALLQKAIRAKAPPALAPGAMIQLGLLGLAYTFRHPAVARSRVS